MLLLLLLLLLFYGSLGETWGFFYLGIGGLEDWRIGGLEDWRIGMDQGVYVVKNRVLPIVDEDWILEIVGLYKKVLENEENRNVGVSAYSIFTN